MSPHPSAHINKLGTTLNLHLSVHLQDGTEVLSSFDGDPIECRIGDGCLAPGLESLVLEMEQGERTQVLTEGEVLFGRADPTLVQSMTRTDLPANFVPAVGQVVAFDAPGGQQANGTIVAVKDDEIRVDFNHPLCRRPLRVTILLLQCG